MHELLQGVRVLDFTTIVLGPYATQILGDLGAEIIKVEPLSGDLFRSVRPGRSPSMGAGFINCNRNKRSIGLDLTNAKAREALAALITTSDAVIHNMRPKSAAKLGVSYDDVKAIKPDIVYCYAPGFGQDGPSADAPAYDDTIQAASGLAMLNADSSGAPRFMPTIIGDKVGGLHLALATLSGIVAHLRTGEGCCIEAPMYESVVSFLMLEQLSGQSFQPPLGGVGYERLLSPNRKPHKTRDGYIAVLPYSTAQWVRFFELIGRQEIAREDRVRDPVQRSRHIDSLYEIMGQAMPARATSEWIDLLNAHDIPCARVNTIADLLADPHLSAVDMFHDVEHPTEGSLRMVRSPFRVAGEAPRADAPTPTLGRDTRAILSEAGLSDAAIDELIASGAACERLDSPSHVATGAVG